MADTGFLNHSSCSSSTPNCGNLDNNSATSITMSGNNAYYIGSDFSHSMPSSPYTYSVQGIEVELNGLVAMGGTTVTMTISTDGGSSFSTNTTTVSFTGSTATHTFGGSTEDYDGVPDGLDLGDLQIKFTTVNGAIAQFYTMQTKIYYTQYTTFKKITSSGGNIHVSSGNLTAPTT